MILSSRPAPVLRSASLATPLTAGPESIAFCRQALQALDGLDKPIDVASAWINMAIACTAGFLGGAFGQRQLDEGIDYCQQALAVLDSMTPTRERASLQASVYNTLGNLHNNAGHWHDAIAAYQGHLAICQEAGYRCRSGISYDNLGQVYEQMGEATFDQAAEAYQAALRIHQECEDPYLEALAWLSWAGLTQAQGQRQQALAHYLHAIDQIRSAADRASRPPRRAPAFSPQSPMPTHTLSCWLWNWAMWPWHLIWPSAAGHARFLTRSLPANLSCCAVRRGRPSPWPTSSPP